MTTTENQGSISDWRSQFANPKGWLGSLVGYVMAIKSTERSLWVLAQLDFQADDRVLEIGFGPGIDLQRVSERAAYVAGIDHSEVMVGQAKRHNRAAICAGRIAVRQASAADPLPYADGSFTIVFSINSFQFWPDPDASLREVYRILRPGGLVATAVQPRDVGATDEDTRLVGERLQEQLAAAGFSQIQAKTRVMKPTAVVCVIGKKEEREHLEPPR